MRQSPDNSAAAQQVDYAVTQLASLSILPATALQYLTKFAKSNFDLNSIAHIIESNPVLTALILSSEINQGSSIVEIVNHIEPTLLQKKLLSAKVLLIFGTDNERVSSREELNIHSLATAVCARELASFSSPKINPQVAFSAGLLHDIGKLAIDEVMPKSFQQLITESKSQNQNLYATEKTYLGLDHTILGKHLAEKWQLSLEITTAIWLHHSPAEIMLTNIPHAEFAILVHLADLIARTCNIGQSGSFDKPIDINELAQHLSLTPEKIQQISDELPKQVAQMTDTTALAKTISTEEYCQLLHKVIAQLNTNPAITTDRQKQLIEQLVSILTHTRNTQKSRVDAETLANLAELAAGAAHELNNPLAVISGRSQLLNNSETDESKKEILSLISLKAAEATDMVSDLMSFAKPARPRPETVSPLVLLNNAIELTTDKHKTAQARIQLENIDNLPDINVDIKQMGIAFSNIISNALESYDTDYGKLRIIGAIMPNLDLVRIEIIDSGCGMSSEVLQKATLPFYSVKPAGRQRGLGLAIANRLIKLNNCSMNIASIPEKGTTVTLLLPSSN